MRLAVAILAAVLAFAGVAEAGTKAGPGVVGRHHRLGLTVVPPPLEGLTASAAAYSLRKLRTAYAGNAVQLRRASDSTVLDVGLVGNDFNTAAAVTFCNATSCFVAKWYDQSGNARDVVQATPANQPAFVFNCIGALPCVRMTATVQTLLTGSITWASVISSLSVVADRSSGTTGQCFFIRKNINVINSGPANQWTTTDFTSSTYNFTATDAVWHAGISVINGAASVARADQTETAGNLAGSAAAGVAYLMGADSTTCNETEAIIWDGYALAASERAALTANQRSYWGF